MIFPKQQMSFEEQRSEPIQKSLEQIIELYLNRKRDEDIAFLKKNFATTNQLITSVGSSQLSGLSSEVVNKNSLIYGENEKMAFSKPLSLVQCLRKQMFRPNFIISETLLLSTFLFGVIQNSKQLLYSALIMIIFSFGVSALRALTLFIQIRKISQSYVQKTKNNIYQVIRYGQCVQVDEFQIVVGDIVELEFKQKVPATGILISNTQILVKENKKSGLSQIKLSLERCLDRIQGMSILDLKLSFEQSTLPSPIILRGSELVKGKAYSILVISVTEQDLLNKFQIIGENKLQSKAYDEWMNGVKSRWANWTLFFGIVTAVFLVLNSLPDSKLFVSNSKVNVQILFSLQLKISIIVVVMQVNPIFAFLNIIFIDLINKLKVNDNLEKLLTVKKILCNERKIIQMDTINAGQIAICDKNDLICLTQAPELHPFMFSMLQQISQLFHINNSSLHSLSKNKCRKIVHVFKRNYKIISSVYEPINLQNNSARQADSHVKQNYLNIKPQKMNEHRSSFADKKDQQKNQKRGSEKVKVQPGLQEIQNLKQIIHSRCRVKSKLVLDGLAGLAENGLKTFYYQAFDLKNLDKMTHVLIQGSIRPIQMQIKQRMLMLSRKMNLIYGLTPILISYHEGSFQSTTSRILICMIGVEILENNEMISLFKDLQQAGIKTTILVNEFNKDDDSQDQILKEYVHRGLMELSQGDKIRNAQSIKQLLKRFVCKQCLIANCDCKDKVQIVANIQPFLEISQKIKIIYDVQQDDFRCLESVYTQVQSNLISINSHNSSASDYLQSIYSCHKFATKIRRSLIFFYAASAIYFLTPIFFWMRNLETVSPLQMGFSFLFISVFFFYIQMLKIIGTVESAVQNKGRVKIATNQCVIRIYGMCLMTMVGSQILSLLHYLIPQYEDNYDLFIHKNGLDAQICKYGMNNSLTTSFVISECLTPQIGLQYSRLSTFITVYCYLCLWSLAILINRNFKSILSVLLYIVSLGTFILIVENMGWLIHGYSQGLTWQHYLIICGATLITILIGALFGQIVAKITIFQHFCGEMQRCIIFQVEQNDYIAKLKSYRLIKKRQAQQKPWDEMKRGFEG